MLLDWKIGRWWGTFDIPSEKLKAIERENDTEDQRKVAMLDTWSKREGRGANCWRLANALYQHGRRFLVELLCKAMLSSSTEESSPNCASAEASTDHTTSSKENYITLERHESSGTKNNETFSYHKYNLIDPSKFNY